MPRPNFFIESDTLQAPGFFGNINVQINDNGNNPRVNPDNLPESNLKQSTGSNNNNGRPFRYAKRRQGVKKAINDANLHMIFFFSFCFRPPTGPLRPIAPQLPPGPPGPPPRPPRPTLNAASGASIVAPPPPPSPVNSSPKGGPGTPGGNLNASPGSPGSGQATASIPQVNPTRQPRPPGPIFNLIPRLPNFTELFGI